MRPSGGDRSRAVVEPDVARVRARILFAFRELVERRKRDMAEILTRRARQGPLRRAWRSQARLEVIEFACGLPHLLKGEFSENVSTESIATPSGSRSGGRRHHAVQFPAMVTDVMYPIANRLWQRVHSQAVEKDRRRRTSLLSSSGGRSSSGVFSVVHGDKLAVMPSCRILASAVSFVGSTPVGPLHLERRARGPKNGSACRRSGRENHMIVLLTRTSISRPIRR